MVSQLYPPTPAPVSINFNWLFLGLSTNFGRYYNKNLKGNYPKQRWKFQKSMQFIFFFKSRILDASVCEHLHLVSRRMKIFSILFLTLRSCGGLNEKDSQKFIYLNFVCLFQVFFFAVLEFTL